MLPHTLLVKATYGQITDHLGDMTCVPHHDGGTGVTWLEYAKPAGPIKWVAGKKNFEIALGGGVFQNEILLGQTVDLLREEGFTVYRSMQVPPNDGAVALGQAAVAAARLARQSGVTA